MWAARFRHVLLAATLGTAAAVANLALPSNAAAVATVPTYVMALANSGGQLCTIPDVDIVKGVIRAKLSEKALVMVDKAASPDPLGDVESSLVSGFMQPVIVASVCKNGNVNLVTINGYTVSMVAAKAGASPAFDVKTGGPIAGPLDAIRAADWSALFGGAAAYANVPFLPIFGDNADVVNGHLERALPLTEVKTSDTLMNLCTASAEKMLVVGQGSLATANLDPFRAVVAASALSFSQPQPWSTVYKVGGAAFSLVGVPNSANITADVYYCNDGPLMQIGGFQHHITGHATRLSVGTNAGVQRFVLNTAIDDLQSQLDCIVLRHRNSRDNTKQLDRLASGAWCDTYVKRMPRDEDVTNAGPATPQYTP